MATGSGILAIRAYLIEEWAFFILEVAWFFTAMARIHLVIAKVSERTSEWKIETSVQGELLILD